MLTDIVLSSDECNQQTMNFDELFNYSNVNQLKNIKSLKAKVDTSDMTLAYLGDICPNLQILKLDYSIIHNLRDLSTRLPNLNVLYLTHCKIKSIEGISTISYNIQELYLSFNLINDISPLLDFNCLKTLDLESNSINSVDDVSLLKCCDALQNLILRGTEAAKNPEYRSLIKKMIPQLKTLDGVEYCEKNKEEIKYEKEKSSQLPQISTISSHQYQDKTNQQKEQIIKLPLLKTNNPTTPCKKTKMQIKVPKVLRKTIPFKH